MGEFMSDQARIHTRDISDLRHSETRTNVMKPEQHQRSNPILEEHVPVGEVKTIHL